MIRISSPDSVIATSRSLRLGGHSRGRALHGNSGPLLGPFTRLVTEGALGHQLRLPLIASRYASYEMRDSISSPQSLTRLLTSANVTVTVGTRPSLLTLNESWPGSGFPLLSHKIRHVPVFFSRSGASISTPSECGPGSPERDRQGRAGLPGPGSARGRQDSVCSRGVHRASRSGRNTHYQRTAGMRARTLPGDTSRLAGGMSPASCRWRRKSSRLPESKGQPLRPPKRSAMKRSQPGVFPPCTHSNKLVPTATQNNAPPKATRPDVLAHSRPMTSPAT
ncbi:hypothetical protein PAE3796A_18480 [Pseudomonas aeruginosa]|nr:hypothetical protein Q057_04691 [Pseudomonas aeruginosa BL03]CAI9862651.1 hypothetical protein PAE3796A_18480 [Pseudomonas aeruginosa]CAI9896036.1 hypothetical protein PAE3796A_18480 [Pseudomonas aeruginosa]